MKLAESLGIAHSVDFKTFLGNPGLNQMINVTGNENVQLELSQYAPAGVEILGGHSARLMWEIVEIYKKSKEYIELLIEGSPNAIFTVDTNRCITGWNKRAGELTGYAKAEVIGKPCFVFAEFPCKEHCGLFFPGEQELIKGKECTIKMKDGEFRVVSKNAELFRDSSGAVIGGIEVFEDITERKNMEEALRLSRQQLMQTLNFLPDPTFVIDKGGAVIVWNKGMEDLTGIAAKDMIGKREYEYALPFYGERRPILVDLALHPDVEAEKRYSNLKREGNLLVGESMLTLRSSEKTRYLWGAATTLFDEDGDIIGAIETIRDMSVYKTAEEALQKSHERFQTVMDSLDALVYVADMETYEILFLNKIGLERWGAVVGKPCWQTLQKGQNGPCLFCTNNKLIDAQGNPTGVLVWESQKSQDGKWYQCRDQAIRWIDGRLVRLEVAIEVTEQRRMQAQFHDKIRDLERFQRVMVGRELKMRDLKNRILELEKILEKK
jgi:PAS domain S-box-containing protein